MEELGKRILEGRAFQKKVVGMMLSVLARALKVCRSLDPMVSGEIDTFPEDFVILGIYGSRHPVILQNRSRGLSRIYESVEAVRQKIAITPSSVAKRLSADRSDPQRVLEVRFKSVEAGWRMVTGQISAEGAWARHDLLINGEITQAMRFLRCHPAGAGLPDSRRHGQSSAAPAGAAAGEAVEGLAADAARQKEKTRRTGGLKGCCRNILSF